MRLRFTIRDLLWLTFVVALAATWWVDHRTLESRRKMANALTQAAVAVAIALLWLCPIALLLHAVWRDSQPFSIVRCTLWMATGLAALFLPASYYQSKHFELSGRFYEWWGVRWFKRWVPDGDQVLWHIRHFLPDYKVIPNRGGLKT